MEELLSIIIPLGFIIFIAYIINKQTGILDKVWEFLQDIATKIK